MISNKIVHTVFSSKILGISFPLILFTICYLILILFVRWESVVRPINLIAIQKEFELSKYVLGERGAQISDQNVYAVAGYAYVTGTPPTKINFEHPPLMKYLYGFSIVLFKTPSVVSFLVFSIFMLSISWLSEKWFSSWSARAVFLFFVFANPIFFEFSDAVLLDLPQATGIVLSLILVWKLIHSGSGFLNTSSTLYVLLGLLFGALSSVKYPFPTTFLYMLLVYLFLFIKTRNLRFILVSVLISVGVYVLLYLPEYLQGWSLLDHARFEWWRLDWYSGKVTDIRGLIFQTIFFGHHPNPLDWESTVKYAEYSWIWPVTFLGYLIYLVKLLFTNSFFKDEIWYYLTFSLGTILLLALGASHAFYLIPLMTSFAYSTTRVFSGFLDEIDGKIGRVLAPICQK